MLFLSSSAKSPLHVGEPICGKVFASREYQWCKPCYLLVFYLSRPHVLSAPRSLSLVTPVHARGAPSRFVFSTRMDRGTARSLSASKSVKMVDPSTRSARLPSEKSFILLKGSKLLFVELSWPFSTALSLLLIGRKHRTPMSRKQRKAPSSLVRRNNFPSPPISSAWMFLVPTLPISLSSTCPYAFAISSSFKSHLHISDSLPRSGYHLER